MTSCSRTGTPGCCCPGCWPGSLAARLLRDWTALSPEARDHGAALPPKMHVSLGELLDGALNLSFSLSLTRSRALSIFLSLSLSLSPLNQDCVSGSAFKRRTPIETPARLHHLLTPSLPTVRFNSLRQRVEG